MLGEQQPGLQRNPRAERGAEPRVRLRAQEVVRAAKHVEGQQQAADGGANLRCRPGCDPIPTP